MTKKLVILVLAFAWLSTIKTKDVGDLADEIRSLKIIQKELSDKHKVDNEALSKRKQDVSEAYKETTYKIGQRKKSIDTIFREKNEEINKKIKENFAILAQKIKGLKDTKLNIKSDTDN